jgi:prepilin-type N-terminal cleavage/methylation domain-containing protein
MVRPASSPGFTLIELIILLVVFALLSAMAVPSFSHALARARAAGTLNRLSGDVFLARALAARAGRPVLIRFTPSSGCADSYELLAEDGGVLRAVTTREEVTGVCLRSNAPQAMRVNGRGMLVGSPRRLYAASGAAVDSATVSMVGRVLRWR